LRVSWGFRKLSPQENKLDALLKLWGVEIDPAEEISAARAAGKKQQEEDAFTGVPAGGAPVDSATEPAASAA